MKKSLKIFLTILLLTVVIFGVTGCGKKEEVKNNDKVAQLDNKKVEQTVEFTRGEWNDSIYTNKFLGLKFNLPSKWTASTDEEIAEMMGVGSDIISDSEDQKEALEKYMENAVVYGMMATNPLVGDNIIIQFQKLPNASITEKMLLDQTKKQVEAVESINYTVEETKTEELCGIEFSTMALKTEVSGINLIQKYYLKIQGDYVSYIVITATSDANLENILSSFSKI